MRADALRKEIEPSNTRQFSNEPSSRIDRINLCASEPKETIFRNYIKAA